jgi:hypothetical protein
VTTFAYHHDYDRGEQEEAQDEEKPEESLGIMSQITVSISHIHRDLKFGWGIFQDIVNMRIDGILSQELLKGIQCVDVAVACGISLAIIVVLKMIDVFLPDTDKGLIFFSNLNIGIACGPFHK